MPPSAPIADAARRADAAQATGSAGARPRGCTCARLRRLTRRVTALYDRELSACGLRVTQFSLLATLSRQGGAQGVPMAALAEAMDMDRTTLTRNLKPLVDGGLAEVQSDPDDRRIRRVLVTRQGEQALADARPAWKRAQQAVNDTLGADTVAALHDWLDAVTPRFHAAPEGT